MNNTDGKNNRLIREISLDKYGHIGRMLDRILELEKENEELMEAPRWWHWISAKMPPEDDGEVLAYDGEYVFIAHFISGVWYDNSLYQLPVKVSYWMPLPEPPEVEDGNGE